MTDADRPPQAGGAEPRRFLTFRIDGLLYGVGAGEVSEVIRVPPVARVPQAPASLLGLANLRGSVLPVASLRRLLGRPEGGGGSGARAIVLGDGAPVALVVDRVEALVAVSPDRIESSQTALAVQGQEGLTGMFQADVAGEPAHILDVRSLLQAAFVQRERPARAARAAGDLLSRPGAGTVGDGRSRLVTFEVAGQDFALPIAAVREIMPAPATARALASGEAAILGVTAYRDTLLPLLSLRDLLSLGGDHGSAPAAMVVVTQVRGALVGLVADRMKAIVPADPARIEPIPAVLAARTGGETRIDAIYRDAAGGRLVSILAPERLFRENVMQSLGTERAGVGQEPGGESDAGESRFVVFRLGDEEFGLPVDAVVEVARVPERITRVPRTPAFLEGVVNLRGEVLPVIDQRRRFGMPPLDARDGCRVVVVRTEHHRAGLIVDAVTGVLPVARDAVEPAPDLAGETTRLVQGVAVLGAQGRMVLLLDPAELLTRTERGLLDAFAGETARR